VIEEFRFHPTAFLKFVRPAILSIYLSLMLTCLDLGLIALVVAPLALIGFLTQIAFYKGTFDPLFPSATGANVVGHIEPAGEVRQQIVISGHHDAAYVFWTLFKYPRFYPFALAATLVMVVFAIIVALALLVAPTSLDTIRLVTIIGAVAWTPFMLGHWYMTGKAVSPGAGDNMIAVAIANEIGRTLAQEAKRRCEPPLRHTRVVLASFDGEESGLKGARFFCERHDDQLRDPAVKTRVVNMECLFRLEHLCVQTSDINGFVPLSKQMNEDLQRIAHDLGFTHFTARPMVFLGGSTDAGEFARRGIESTTILGMVPDMSMLSSDFVYHTPRDTTDNVDAGAVKATLDILLTYLFEKDAELH